jgi:hypothetical protein
MYTEIDSKVEYFTMNITEGSGYTQDGLRSTSRTFVKYSYGEELGFEI